MRKDGAAQEGRVVWQSGESTEGRDQPVLCSSLHRILTANALVTIRNTISRYMHTHTHKFCSKTSGIINFYNFVSNHNYCKKWSEYCVLNEPDN